MQSMIKRKIDVSITAQVDLISQLVLDTYALHMDRYMEKGRQEAIFTPGNYLYYRMTRQTGHTAALKRLLSADFSAEKDVYVQAIFHSGRERRCFLDSFKDETNGIISIEERLCGDVGTEYRGLNPSRANILVFSDTLHDTRRMDAAQKFLKNNPAHFPNLALVVFLG